MPRALLSHPDGRNSENGILPKLSEGWHDDGWREGIVLSDGRGGKGIRDSQSALNGFVDQDSSNNNGRKDAGLRKDGKEKSRGACLKDDYDNGTMVGEMTS